MRKRTPKQSPPDVMPRQDENIIRQVRHYKVITPLFGGGAEPHKPDAVTVVRGSEIRGLLRFWWRATRGGQFNGDLDKMRTKEEEIWGGAARKSGPGPSEVVLHVNITRRGHPFQAVDHKGNPVKNIGNVRSIYSYVAFPLRDVPGAQVLGDVEFELEIQFPKALAKEVKAALWAWETFSGVGARTRRGFGALELVSLVENNVQKGIDKPATCVQVKQWIQQHLKQYVVAGTWPDNVPHLSQTLLFVSVQKEGKGDFETAIEAWNYLIGKLQQFRQKRHKKYGLSLWPEANVIRNTMGLKLKWPPNASSPSLVRKFPRAHFGLPIIFHMPYDKKLKTDFTLRGMPAPGKDAPIDRLASPLILRPLACDKDAVGLAVVLEALREPPYGLEVDGFPQNKKHVNANLTSSEAKTEPIRRILNGEPDVLKAFLKTLGWKE